MGTAQASAWIRCCTQMRQCSWSGRLGGCGEPLQILRSSTPLLWPAATCSLSALSMVPCTLGAELSSASCIALGTSQATPWWQHMSCYMSPVQLNACQRALTHLPLLCNMYFPLLVPFVHYVPCLGCSCFAFCNMTSPSLFVFGWFTTCPAWSTCQSLPECCLSVP